MMTLKLMQKAISRKTASSGGPVHYCTGPYWSLNARLYPPHPLVGKMYGKCNRTKNTKNAENQIYISMCIYILFFLIILNLNSSRKIVLSYGGKFTF